MKSLLIIGAGSRISREFATISAKNGWTPVLCGRDATQTAATARDVSVRSGNNSVSAATFDLGRQEDLPALIRERIAPGTLQGVLIASGAMPSEKSMAQDSQRFAEMAATNYVGVVRLIETVLPHIVPSEDAFLSCLTSVAGDRGRASNFRYGSSKAALSAYLEGLTASRARLPLIQDVKLGPVDTPLNFGVSRMPFAISPDAAARAIWKNLQAGRRKAYVPAKWLWIMLVIRLLPFSLYRRLPL